MCCRSCPLGRCVAARLERGTVVRSAVLLLTLAPMTSWLLTHACHCDPSDTKTGKRYDVEIRKPLR
jgi:hypothetical protein